MNGYSPYMEHVFVSPTDPLPAPLDGITPAQLHELAAYARAISRRAHPRAADVRAHAQHAARRAVCAARPSCRTDFCLRRTSRFRWQYLSRIVAQELAAVGHPPFFHIGSDETATLGLGQTQAYVAQRGRSQAYADHIVAMNRLIAPSGARIMLWDDGIESDPGDHEAHPADAVIVNWHYGDEATFEPYIRTIARRRLRADGRAGREQLERDISGDRLRRWSTSGASSTKGRRRTCSASSKPCGTTTARRSTKRRGIRCSTRPRRHGSAATRARAVRGAISERVFRRRRSGYTRRRSEARRRSQAARAG